MSLNWVKKQIVFSDNSSQNIWDLLIKLSKIGLGIESLAWFLSIF